MLVAALATLGGLACVDSNSPNDGHVRPPSDLNVLHLAQVAPPLYSTTVSFLAKYDEDTEGEIFFADDQGQPGERFLRFKVDKFALSKKPDGTLFGPGDQVQISITVVADSLLFEFQPQGLQFNPLNPAQLNLEYNHAGDNLEGDFNDDDHVDQEDDDIEATLALWHQAMLGDPFVKLQTLVVVDSDEIEAEIPGFSRYALAY